MTTRTALPLLAILALTSCVHGEPVAPIPEAPSVSTYVSETGDSLLLFEDGSFKARPSEGIGPTVTVSGIPVSWWAHGVYLLDAAGFCARPNYLDASSLRCGALRGSDGAIDDPVGIFLWDGVPRRWKSR